MKKPIVIVSTILAVVALAACTSQTGSPVDLEVANTAMLRAMTNMTNMSIGSLDLSLTTDSTVSRDFDIVNNDYGYYDESMSAIVDGTVNLKISDLWGTAPKAHLNVVANEVSIHDEGSYNGGPVEVFINESFTDQTLNAYYDNEFVYVDASGAPEVLAMITAEMPEPENFPTKLKGPVGPVSELGIPDMTDPANAMPSEELESMIGDVLPMLATLPNVTATQSGGELTIVYELTQEDLPALIETFYLQLMTSMGAEIPSSLDASMQAELDLIVSEITDAIDLTILRYEVRIDTTRNIPTYMQARVDVTVTIEDVYYEGYYDEGTMMWVDDELPYTEIVDVDMTTTIELNKFSEAVTITFPTDLATYEDMSQMGQVGV